MTSKRTEDHASRLRRLDRQIFEMTVQIKKSSPEAAMHLRVKLRDLREGQRLTQQLKA